MDLLNVFLMAEMGGEGNPIASFLPLILIVIVFYFFMIRPQTKKAKEMKKFRQALGKGDRIVTIGGVHGKVVDLKEKTVTMEVEGGMKLKIERSAISMEYTTGTGESELTQQKK